MIFIISAPSGAGKTTIVNKLLGEGEFIRPITSTTRPAREGEVNGVHYHFLSKDQFEANIAHGVMFEYAEVYDNYYGITHESINDAIESGKDVLWIMDIKGMVTVRSELDCSQQGPCSTIFITPPSIDALRSRLISRGDKDIEGRLSQASTEMSHSGLFDHIIVNDNLNECCEGIKRIIANQKLARSINV